jgi:hypothetical protein
MLKVMAFLVKRPGISSEELVDYYENRPVPLILSLAPPPPGTRATTSSETSPPNLATMSTS